ncbi:MAG: DUF4956 domain-containing protein [Anaerolineaceae bacterium]|nr:DUF4956 domain-containing protein [Anaerolineaceae bacterium]
MDRKLIFRITTLFLGFIVMLFTVLPTAAQADQGFTESFDDSQLSGWEHAPEVIVTDGVLRIGPAQFAAPMGGWQDFTLTFKLRYSGEGETHVNYRATEQGSYLLVLYLEGIRLIKTVPQGEHEELAQANSDALNTSDWINVQIVLAENTHTISINGENLINITDSAPLSPGGLVFVSAGQRTSDLDDVTMQLSTVAAEQGPAPAEPSVSLATESVTPTDQASLTQTFQEFFQSLSTNQGSTFTAEVFVVNLLLAVFTSFILSRVYIYWGGSLSNRRKFAANFMLVTVTTTFIILVVRSSIALSLGLVGALSIIRFRAAIKEPEELAYLFFAISLGIGLGDNQRAITLVALTVVVIIIGLSRLLRQTQADVNLHLTLSSNGPNKITLEQAMNVLAQHTEKMRLLQFDETSEALEMSFVVEFRHIANLNNLRSALQEISPDLHISFLDNKGVW